MNKYFISILIIISVVSCQYRTEDVYKLNFSDSSFTAKGVKQNALEDGAWEIYNFMGTPLEHGEFQNGLRYGDWIESDKSSQFVTNWAIHEDTAFYIKVNIPYKFDTLEFGDFYYKILYKNHQFLDNIAFSIDNPTDTIISINDIHLKSEDFLKGKNKNYSLKRMKLKDNIHDAFLDEYTVIDSPSKEFYMLHFYTKLENSRLIEITIKGYNLFNTQKIFYKIIMNCFLKDERVFNPFVVDR